MKKLLMSQTNLSSESGRSMVEMLGVLAIIGVLSIGGIAGYRHAMAKYQANEITHNVIQRALLLSAAALSPTNRWQGECCGVSMELPRDVGSFEYNAGCKDYQTILVSVSNVPQDTCNVILQNQPVGLVGFLINGTNGVCWEDCGGNMYCPEPLTCKENNQIHFLYDVELALPKNG